MVQISDYLFNKSNAPKTLTLKDDETLWEFIERHPELYWDFFKLSTINIPMNWDFFQRFVNKSWDWKALSLRSDLIFNVVLENGEKDWNWSLLSDNECITLNDIEQNPDQFWSFNKRHVPESILRKCPTYNVYPQPNNPLLEYYHFFLYNSRSPEMKWKNILDNSDKSWDWDFLSSRSDLNVSVITKISDKSWNWSKISENYALKKIYKLIETFPDKPWDWNMLSGRPDIDMSFISKFPTNWNWFILSRNNYIIQKSQIVEKYSEMPWDWDYLSLGDTSLVLKFPDKPWNWLNISRKKSNPGIWELIAAFPNRFGERNMEYIARHIKHTSEIEWDIVYKTIDLWDLNILFFEHGHNWDLVQKRPKWTKWNWKSVSRIVPWDIFEKYINNPDFTWNYHVISKKNNIPWDIVIRYPHIPWKESNISRNLSLTLDFIKKFPYGPWNSYIIKKRFDYSIEEVISAKKIQRAWIQAYYNPNYLICRRRLKRQFEDLESI
jgi:hypothetical protein